MEEYVRTKGHCRRGNIKGLKERSYPGSAWMSSRKVVKPEARTGRSWRRIFEKLKERTTRKEKTDGPEALRHHERI